MVASSYLSATAWWVGFMTTRSALSTVARLLDPSSTCVSASSAGRKEHQRTARSGRTKGMPSSDRTGRNQQRSATGSGVRVRNDKLRPKPPLGGPAGTYRWRRRGGRIGSRWCGSDYWCLHRNGACVRWGHGHHRRNLVCLWHGPSVWDRLPCARGSVTGSSSDD